MWIYLVGGAVRDELLGYNPPDRDYVVIGATEEAFLRAYPGSKKVGREGRCVFIYRGREYTLSDQSDICSDLKQRDLTINAAAKDEHGRIFSLARTQPDLRDRVLRPVHTDNFRDDPLRCYRAARMAACLPEFSLHTELENVLRDMSDNTGLDRIAAERVCGEVRKACGCPAPGRFLRVIADYDLTASWFAELAHLRDTRGSFVPDTDLDNLESTAQGMDRLRGDSLRVWMGLCSALENVSSQDFTPTSWNPEAARMARDMAQRLRMPVAFIRAGERAAGWLRTAVCYHRLSPEAKVDLLTDLAAHNLQERMLAVAVAVSEETDPETWRRDLRRILSTKLPPDKRGLGPESGRILRRLRYESLRKD